MTSPPMRMVQQLNARLQEQILDVAHLRAALAVQMDRIAGMYDHEGHAARKTAMLSRRRARDPRKVDGKHATFAGEVPTIDPAVVCFDGPSAERETEA